MHDLEDFIIEAKAATYVGNGQNAAPSRLGAHDLTYERGGWAYRDSYFGGTDFLGQETVWQSGNPVWAMNYYGYILRPELIDARQAGMVIKQALTLLYAQKRFLGGFSHTVGAFVYQDNVSGSYLRFHGVEHIEVDGVQAYQLRYHGGLVRA